MKWLTLGWASYVPDVGKEAFRPMSGQWWWVRVVGVYSQSWAPSYAEVHGSWSFSDSLFLSLSVRLHTTLFLLAALLTLQFIVKKRDAE